MFPHVFSKLYSSRETIFKVKYLRPFSEKSDTLKTYIIFLLSQLYCIFLSMIALKFKSEYLELILFLYFSLHTYSLQRIPSWSTPSPPPLFRNECAVSLVFDFEIPVSIRQLSSQRQENSWNSLTGEKNIYSLSCLAADRASLIGGTTQLPIEPSLL